MVGVAKIDGSETIIAATAQARAMLCKVEEINYLSGPGKGVILIKLKPEEDRVLGFIASVGDRDLLTVETSRGAEQTISTTKYEITSRGGKGRELLQRGQFTRIVVRRTLRPAPPSARRTPGVGVTAAAVHAQSRDQGRGARRWGPSGPACARWRARVDTRSCGRRTGTSACRKGG